MRKKAQNGSRLFFIEFLIVLFFFLIISTVCLRLFAAAHGITRRADALSHAQTTAASIAEVIAAGDGSPESVAAYFPAAVVTDQELTLTCDSSFDPCSADEAYYTMIVSFSGADPENADASDDHGKSALITVTDRNGAVFYELSVFCHIPFTREEVLS